MSNSEHLVIYPMPSLVATLINREQAKGSPLTEAEVVQIRDSCPSVATPVDVARAIDEKRGYKDIDPENCWAEWQETRKRRAEDDTQRPNKSPEPTAVGAVSSAIAVHVASRRWLSFFR